MRDRDKLEGQIRICPSKMSLSLQVRFEGQNEGQNRLFIENVPRDKMRDKIDYLSKMSLGTK